MKQRTALVIEKAPDQALTLTKMLAEAHAVGAHVHPLAKCEACRADPGYFTKRKAGFVVIEPTVVPGLRVPKAIDDPENQRWQAASKLAFPPKAPRGSGRVPAPRHPRVETIQPTPGERIVNIVEAILADPVIPTSPKRSKKAPVPQVVEQPRKLGAGETFPPIVETVLPELRVNSATREEWMLRAIVAITPWIEEHGTAVPPVRISTGWPAGRGPKSGVRGQCFMPAAVEDGQPAIFISPDQNDVTLIVGIIAHEMVHAVGNFGHRGGFAKLAAAMGYTAPFTDSANRTDVYTAKLAALAEALGPFPHSPVHGGYGLAGPVGLMGPSGILPAGIMKRPPVQTTRMLKVVCPVDGYTVRTTRRWLDVGYPSCPEESGASQPGKHIMSEEVG